MRQELSVNRSRIITVIVVVIFLLFVILTTFSFYVGGTPIVSTLIALSSAASLGFRRNLAEVHIDDKYVYVRRHSREIQVDAQNIEDIDYWRWTDYLVLKFKMPTDFGYSIIFEPKGGSGPLAPDSKGAEAFEKIGRLCGWRK